jgi:hypothetical protein
MGLGPHCGITVVVALSLVTQGCATPGQPITQTVKVETPGCLQVTCELSNDQGRWLIARTPGAVTLTTSQAALKVSCQADDGATGSAGSPSSLPPMTNTGLLAGGVVGAGAGAALAAPALAFIPPLGVVILLSGVAAGMVAGQAMESGQRGMRYPDLIRIPMHCGPAATPAEAAAAAAMPLGLNIRSLPAPRARELGIGEQGAVLVDSVDVGGRAEAVGLRDGDLILAANGEPLGASADLEDRVAKLAAGSALTLRIWRQGQFLELVLRRPRPPP